MRVVKRNINKGEVFPCTFKTAKSIFNNTDVELNFACYGRDFGTFANTPDRFYVKHNVKGKVVAAMYIRNKYPNPLLNFYVLKSAEYSDELRVVFERDCLQEFYSLYNRASAGELTQETHLMLVALYNGKLVIHKTSYRS